MPKRTRYYLTTTGNAVGVDFIIRTPDRRVICSIMGLSLYDDGSGIDQAKADAGLIVDALNAYRKQPQARISQMAWRFRHGVCAFPLKTQCF